MVNRYIPTVGAVCLFALPLLAQDTAEHNRRNEIVKGATVIIEGCVTAGQKPNTYVLGTVREVHAIQVERLRKRIYWVENVKTIKDHVGHQLRLTGVVKDLERSQIDIELGAGPKGGAVATIEGPGGSDVSMPTGTVGVGPVGAKAQSDKDVLITLIKFKVTGVTRLAGTCS